MNVRAHCFACGFDVTFIVKLNEHGFYEFPQGYCPNDMSLLDQDVTHSLDMAETQEDEDNGS